jgi:8-oxo-dGTP pyrophosphatase MutT (NUDIX family)
MAAPILEPISDLAFARAVLAAYPAPDAEQGRVRDRMLAFLDAHPADAHLRSCVPGHFTASSLLVDRACGKALLTHHRKLGRWLQIGGHCDGDANFAHVAWREMLEESGIEPRSISAPVDLDIHVIPARAGEPEHLHLDVRFLTEAPAGAQETANDESLRLAWFAPHEIGTLDADDSVRRLFALAFGGIKDP